ncbi:MAG: hypothetical protein WCI46_14665, partial [Verrucomicrobiota bacterium]
FRAGESTRAKLAKDAKTRSIQHDEFTRAEKEQALYPPSNQDATRQRPPLPPGSLSPVPAATPSAAPRSPGPPSDGHESKSLAEQWLSV